MTATDAPAKASPAPSQCPVLLNGASGWRSRCWGAHSEVAVFVYS